MKNGKIVYKNGDVNYYVNDKLHREDGPAIEHFTGDKKWYINGKRCTEEQIAEIKLNMEINKVFKEQFESKLG